MYESPINRICEEIQTKIIEQEENQILQAVKNCGIAVDKEELIRALMYDRQQYEKGYADAKAEQRWIPVSERLPKAYQQCLFTVECFHWDGEPVTYKVIQRAYGGETNFIAWMPLPKPWKGEQP